MDKLLKDALIVETVLKKQIKEQGDQITDLEKAIAIWCREHAPSNITFGNDDEAIKWFTAYTNAMDMAGNQE